MFKSGFVTIVGRPNVGKSTSFKSFSRSKNSNSIKQATKQQEPQLKV